MGPEGSAKAIWIRIPNRSMTPGGEVGDFIDGKKRRGVEDRSNRLGIRPISRLARDRLHVANRFGACSVVKMRGEKREGTE